MTNEALLQDSELAPADIRGLTGADALTAFFARLTANVYGRARQERLNQTSEAVGAMILEGPIPITGTYPKAVGEESPLTAMSLMVPGEGIEPSRS